LFALNRALERRQLRMNLAVTCHYLSEIQLSFIASN